MEVPLLFTAHGLQTHFERVSDLAAVASHLGMWSELAVDPGVSSASEHVRLVSAQLSVPNPHTLVAERAIQFTPFLKRKMDAVTRLARDHAALAHRTMVQAYAELFATEGIRRVGYDNATRSALTLFVLSSRLQAGLKRAVRRSRDRSVVTQQNTSHLKFSHTIGSLTTAPHTLHKMTPLFPTASVLQDVENQLPTAYSVLCVNADDEYSLVTLRANGRDSCVVIPPVPLQAGGHDSWLTCELCLPDQSAMLLVSAGGLLHCTLGGYQTTLSLGSPVDFCQTVHMGDDAYLLWGTCRRKVNIARMGWGDDGLDTLHPVPNPSVLLTKYISAVDNMAQTRDNCMAAVCMPHKRENYLYHARQCVARVKRKNVCGLFGTHPHVFDVFLEGGEWWRSCNQVCTARTVPLLGGLCMVGNVQPLYVC